MQGFGKRRSAPPSMPAPALAPSHSPCGETRHPAPAPARPVPSAGATSAWVRRHWPRTWGPGPAQDPRQGPPHTPALAGHPRQPQAIAQMRAFKKAACPGSAPRPRINARLPWKREGRTRARSLEAAMQHRAVVSAREARRTALPPASTTHHGSALAAAPVTRLAADLAAALAAAPVTSLAAGLAAALAAAPAGV